MGLVIVPKKRTKIIAIWKYFFLLVLLTSCGINKNIPIKYYSDNRQTLDSIQQLFLKTGERQKFSIGFIDNRFNCISIELITDTLKYLYNFNTGESRISDTLSKFRINGTGLLNLIRLMKSIQCIWISNIDYYESEKKYTLTSFSIKPKRAKSFLLANRYYILLYFPIIQNYKKNRLLGNNKIMKINARVAYTISAAFR
jgi:hypothetical protein